MRRLISLSVICAMMAVVMVSHAATPEVGISLPQPDTVKLDWQAIPGQTYHVKTTTNLADSWTDLTPGGFVAPNVLGTYSHTTTDTTGFFQVMKKDTNPPEIATLLPTAGAIAVDSGTSVSIVLTDETGIDTNSIVLSVAGWTDLTLASPYLSYNANTLVFTPPSSLGGSGAVISDTLTVADLLGNTLTNYTWTFQLGRPIVATSDFLSLLPQTPSSPLNGPAQMNTLAGDEYYISDVTDTSVIFSYTGTPPVIPAGQKLVSFDTAHLFYREAVSSQTDPGQQLITVLTTDLQLTDLVSTGSLSSIDFTDADPLQGQGAMAAGAMNMHVAFGDDFSGLVLCNNANLKLHLTSASWSFVGDVDVALDLYWLKLRSLDASASGMLTLDLDPEVIFYQAISSEGSAPIIPPVSHIFGAMAGPVPVWVEVVMELNAGFTYNAEASGNAYTSIHAQKEIAFSVRMRESEWSRVIDNPPLVLEGDPITWNIQGNANVKVYVQPKLTVFVYSLAGVGVDIKPYVELDGSYQSEPVEWEWGLYMGISSTLSIENRIGLPEPEWEMFNIRKLLLYDSYPTDIAPSFIAPFPDRTVQTGQSLTLSAEASGMPTPSYRWYFNGDIMPWATSAEYVIASAQPGDVGTYSVQASNSSGSIDTSCGVTVTTSSSDIVWVWIDDPGVPGHEGFTGYMSRYETTNAQYCDFLNSALASGDVRIQSSDVYGNSGSHNDRIYYDMDSLDAQISYSGGTFFVESRDGYSMNNHPVVEVSWYGATAFCNYYGYRLPTEWEWQAVADYNGSYTYGCGTTINQSKANYYDNGYANPLGLSSYPYTSPVNHYPSYGYGMNDMAGNVHEWTDSWYSSNSSYRVFRGGGWFFPGSTCSVSLRSIYYPHSTHYGIGFRVCR
jgi:Sulfatase-modifying factor enzyme 1/Immunoglobulin I-set domain